MTVSLLNNFQNIPVEMNELHRNAESTRVFVKSVAVHREMITWQVVAD